MGDQHRQFELLVADAQRQFEENGKVQNLSFWSFKVMCRSFLPSYQNPPLFGGNKTAAAAAAAGGSPTKDGGRAQNYIDSGAGYVDYCSWHRYSDFEWLLDNLQYENPGEIFPPLPPKENDATKDKMQDLVAGTAHDNPKLVPFVQARIRWLNMHFQVLMDMPQVHESTHVRAFLAMEESAWFTYKATVDAARHGTGVEKVAGKLSRFFGKVTAPKPIVVYDAASEFGRIADAQGRLAAHLKMSQYRLNDVEMIALHQKKAVTTLEDTIAFTNGGKPLPPTLAFYGHFVAHTGDKTRGVVRHVDAQNYAYVQWSTLDANGNAVPSGKLDRIPISELKYPPNGLSDPVHYSAVEAVSQLESFFAYVQHRSETRDLEKLIDLVAFWRYYAESIGEVIKKMADIEQKRHVLAQEASKLSDVTKRSAKQEDIDMLHTGFIAAERRFKASYATLFRPLQRKGLFSINLLVGKICYNLLNDDDWPNRLARCDHVLNPNFDVPDEVAGMIADLANGAPPPGAADADAQPASPPQQQQKQARASSAAVTESEAPTPASTVRIKPAPAAANDSSDEDEAPPPQKQRGGGSTQKGSPTAASPSPKRHADPHAAEETAPPQQAAAAPEEQVEEEAPAVRPSRRAASNSNGAAAKKEQTKHDMFANASDDDA